MPSIFDEFKTVDDYRRAEQEFQLKKQQAQGSLPAALQVARSLQIAQDAGDTQAINNILVGGKLADKGLIQNPDGTYTEANGYGTAVGGIAAQKKGMEREAEKNVDLVMNPQIASGEAAARLQQQLQYEPNIKAKTTEADIAAKARADAVVNLPKAESQADNALNLITSIRNDPGLPAVVGAPNVFKGRIPFVGNVMGSPAADFQAKIDQLGGKQFLEAFESLKGAGQITEVEGAKATNAIGRMQTSQSESGFKQALGELEQVIRTGVQRQKLKAAPRSQAEIAAQVPPELQGELNAIENNPIDPRTSSYESGERVFNQNKATKYKSKYGLE